MKFGANDLTPARNIRVTDAPSNKPRLRLMRGYLWLCDHKGFHGVGATAEDAHDEWITNYLRGTTSGAFKGLVWSCCMALSGLVLYVAYRVITGA